MVGGKIMKTKLLTICLLLFTSQVFAEIKSFQKPITDAEIAEMFMMKEKCAANSTLILHIFETRPDKKKFIQEEEAVLIRFNYFTKSLIKYSKDKDKFLSEEEITKKTLIRVNDLAKIMAKDLEMPIIIEDMEFCKSVFEQIPKIYKELIFEDDLKNIPEE